MKIGSTPAQVWSEYVTKIDGPHNGKSTKVTRVRCDGMIPVASRKRPITKCDSGQLLRTETCDNCRLTVHISETQ